VAQVFEDVACTVCGCVCDDLRLSVENARIVRAEGACKLAEPWFLSQDSRRPPPAEINGQAAPLEAALDEAAQILDAAHSPLVYGLSRSSTDGQRAAARLADRIGATIDTTASLCHAPSILALQEVGESTCTLGEAKNRADLVVFWGSNPVDSHPRHFERYSVWPPGMFLPNGRADRTVVVVDVRPTPSSEEADLFVQVEPGQDFEALWTLRGLVRGEPLAPDARTGAPLEVLVDLASRMKACRCGVLFFGLGLTQSGLGNCNVEALLRLVTDLNAYTRFHAKRMRVYGDVAGADTVLCWQTGYPFSVSLNRGYPRYGPSEYSANDVLGRGEADACLLVGSEGVPALSPAARQHLQSIPTICLDYPTVESFVRPAIRFSTAVYGVHRPGTAYRMDEVPIPLRAVLPTDYASDAEVLDAISDRTQWRGCVNGPIT
jgi:formylmethanofuran dehydrogenase subunit B